MLFLLFITILNFLYTYGAYDDSFARNKIFPMASAAYSGSPELCVHDNFDNSTLIRQLTVSCDAIHDTCSGFIAISYSDNAIILSFRGASAIQVDIEVLEMLYDKEDRFPGGGNVSHYFYKAFLDIWNAGMKDDFFILKSAFPTAELWVTGHSLGASLATLAAGYIAALQYYPANQIKLVTFGQPRTGDLGYANYIDNTIAYAYRVVHQIDIVPHVPFYNLNLGQIRNYTHHKSEVWYNNDMTVSNWYTECDENESNKCSDQFEKFGIFGYDILDHLSYFNKLADYATFGCPRH